jgi:hypothetical protein
VPKGTPKARIVAVSHPEPKASDAAEVAHPKPALRKTRALPPFPESVSEPPVPIPDGCRAFQLRKDGRWLSEFTATGVERTRFDLARFTVAWISERWGGGEYHCAFKDSHGRSKGMVRFRLAGEAKSAPTPPVVRAERMPEALLPPVDPLDMMLKIKSVADAEVSRSMTVQSEMIRGVNEHATKMFELAMGRETAIAAAGGERLARLEQAVLSVAQQLQALRSAPPSPDPDPDPDDDEEDDEEEDEEATRVAPGEGGVPGYPDEWDSFGKMAYRFLVRNMPALERQIQEWGPALIADFVKKAQEKAAAATAANGLQPIPVVAP